MLDKPNILFIIADDLNKRQGFYGDTIAYTPNLDRLSEQGVTFDRAYSPSTVCTPSRKALITGLNIHKVGRGNNNFLKEFPDTMTMPRYFRENGYQTAKIGKIAHADTYEGKYCWDMMLYADNIDNKNVNHIQYKNSNGELLAMTDVFSDNTPTTDQLRVKGFKDFITDKWDRSKPFFFGLGFHSPHQPLEVQQRHLDKHKLENMPLTITPDGATPMSKPPEYLKEMLESLHEPLEDTATPVEKATVNEDTQRHMIRDYYSSITMIDELIGDIDKFLNEQKLSDNTIVVFTADQGYFLGYRGLWCKHYLYPEVLEVPMIVRYPNVSKAGERAEGIVELIDLFPTLCDMAGIEIPTCIDGESFKHLVIDPSKKGKECTYAQGIMYAGHAVTTEDYSYLQWDEKNIMVPTCTRALDENIGTALEGIIDGRRVKKLVLEVEPEQRWINVEAKVLASVELYDIKKDPKAWFNIASNSQNADIIKYHKTLIRDKD